MELLMQALFPFLVLISIGAGFLFMCSINISSASCFNQRVN
jgi:hypothetical protein